MSEERVTLMLAVVAVVVLTAVVQIMAVERDHARLRATGWQSYAERLCAESGRHMEEGYCQ
jgi:hypothetical protein